MLLLDVLHKCIDVFSEVQVLLVQLSRESVVSTKLLCKIKERLDSRDFLLKGAHLVRYLVFDKLYIKCLRGLELLLYLELLVFEEDKEFLSLSTWVLKVHP
jgi:hypothetical protein